MTMFFLSALVCSLLAAAAATDVEQCSGKSFDLSDKVQFSCKKLPCRLRRGSSQHISIAFTPDTDMKDVNNRVTALIAGANVPFVGVDGVSVCDKIENEAGEKVHCPLKAGTKYIYKDSFPILNFYPIISLKVHWALENNKKELICFEIPAKITK